MMDAERRKFIQDLYIRVCRDSGFKMEYTRAAHFAGKVGGFHAMDVWTAMPSLQVMEQIAKGEHPAALRARHAIIEGEKNAPL